MPTKVIQSLRAFRRAGKREEGRRKREEGRDVGKRCRWATSEFIALCTIGQCSVHLELMLVDLVWVISVWNYFGVTLKSVGIHLGSFCATLA